MANANSKAAQGGIKIQNLDPSLAKLIPDEVASSVFAGGLQTNEAVGVRPGAKAHNLLYVPANLVDGDTITIGADTFEVDIINTDTAVNTSGALDGTSNPVLVTLASAPATDIDPGDLMRIENEILKVISRNTAKTQYVCARARCGTAIATHADNSDVFQSDAAPASNVPVGLVTTLTPAVFGPAFVQEFNNAAPTSTVKASTESANFTAYATAAGVEILLIANAAGVDTTACTEDFAASTDDVWANATMVGGLDPGILGHETVSRAFTSTEELIGRAHFAFPFPVREALVQVRVTATGQPVAWNGQVVVGYNTSTGDALPSTVVTLLNVGPASTAYITPFDSTMTAIVQAYE